MRRATFAIVIVLLTVCIARAEEQDPNGYQRILLPIITDFDVRGAYGSLWRTELMIRNDGDSPVQFFQTACGYFCSCPVMIECLAAPIPPHTTYDGRGRVFHQDLVRNDGAFVYVQRTFADQVKFNLRIRDVSRSATSIGTELPVVRQFLTTTTTLLNVPLDMQFRQYLRIYGVTSPSGAGDVIVRVFELDGDQPLAEKAIRLIPSEEHSKLPSDSEFPQYPAFAEIPNMRALSSTLDGVARVRIEVQPVTPGLVFWAFVSVTNNESQQVTTITPQ